MINKSKTTVAHATHFDTKHIALMKVAFGALLLFGASQITIPLQPVPVTLQTIAFMLIGLTYSPLLAFYTVSAWLIAGLAGAPVFANFKFGVATLVGPTGGYIVGMCIASVVMAQVQKHFKKNSLLSIAGNCLLGALITHLFGVGYLASIIGVSRAIELGFIPFILPGIAKTILLSGSVRFLRRV